MALFTIADLHLPLGIDKPMDIFGGAWTNYVERLKDNWQKLVNEDDTVVIPGDFSWATYTEQSVKDFEFLEELNGRKILLKGNHDFWWTTMNKLKKFTQENNFKSVEFLQNNSFMYKNIAICGTRGWKHPSWDGFNEEDKKIYDREVIRLELSLNSVQDCEEIYVFTHYPPISMQKEGNAFCELMKKYKVIKCFYGHLHSAAHASAFNGICDGIEYKLIAGDYLKFIPLKIS